MEFQFHLGNCSLHSKHKEACVYETDCSLSAGRTHLGFPEKELQVPAAQDAVVLDVARQVHGAGAVHGAVNLHVAVDGVQVFLLILELKRKKVAV